MASDVEPVPPVLSSSGKTAHEPLVLLQDGRRHPVLAELVGGRETGGPGAHHDHV